MKHQSGTSKAEKLENLEKTIDASLGKIEVDLLIKDVNLINVFSGEIYKESIAVYNGIIVGFGDYKAKAVLNAKGLYAVPGLIDAHMHIESTMLSPREFAKCLIKHGTTAVITDPHEIANVCGIDGIKYLIEESDKALIDIFIMAPSCVPSSDLETSGAEIKADDIGMLLKHEKVIGLAEVMNYPGVLSKNREVLEKIIASENFRRDGHAPMLSGKKLNAYIACGIETDHECTEKKEALEKLRKGIKVLIREGTCEKNMEDLIDLVNEKNYERFMVVSDDRSPLDLLNGHLNLLLKKMVSLGVDEVTAIRLVTKNPAEHYGLNKRGAISLGYIADIVIFEDLKNFKVKTVVKNGEIVVKNGKLLKKVEKPEIPEKLRNTVKIKWNGFKGIEVKAKGEKIRVIEVVPGQIVTKRRIEKAKVKNGVVVSDTKRDIIKISVFERHGKSGNVGVGFVKGFGIKEGAIASSIAHDAHNIVAVGVCDDDIIKAVKEIEKMQGGIVVVKEQKVLANLPLPIAGIISDKSVEKVAESLEKLKNSTKHLGCKLDDPFMTLSFLALPVVPEIKITDKGLVENFRIVDLFV